MSIRKAHLVLVPSAHVKQTVLGQVRGLPSDSVRAIPWGLSPEFRVCERQKTQAVLERLGLPKRYVLFVGTVEPRKNLGGLLRAFELLTERHDVAEHLVIAGVAGWGMKEFRRRMDNGRGRIHYLGYIPQKTLPHNLIGEQMTDYEFTMVKMAYPVYVMAFIFEGKVHSSFMINSPSFDTERFVRADENIKPMDFSL